MDPQQLRTFATVARLASFSAASRELSYTQSAVSQQIAALEQDLRVLLLHRRPVAPTAAGERLLEHAGPILLRLDAARADLARLAGTPRTRLSVGISPLAAPSRVALALDLTRRQLPRVEITLEILDRRAVIEAVASGRLDAGVVDGLAAASDPLTLPGLAPVTARVLAQEPLAVLLPESHPLASRRALDLTSLADAPWVDAPAAALPLADLRAATGLDAFPARLRCEGTDLLTLAALVAAGHGLALLPAAVGKRLPGTSAVPLSGSRLWHRTEVVHAGAGAEAVSVLLEVLTGG